MRTTAIYVLVLAISLLIAPSARAAEAAPQAAPPEFVENFRLIDHNGHSHELYNEEDAIAVVLFTQGCGCPIVRQSVPELNRLRDAYADKGVVFFMINANPQDTHADASKEAAEFEIAMPILMDPTQDIVRSLASDRTAEAIVIDPKDKWRIVYRGPVDDRFGYGARKNKADHRWLQDALDARLAGEAVDVARVGTKGCLINFAEHDAISYENDIVPILESKCVTCHTDGGVAPFAMSSYRKVKGWADMMRETVRTKRMPPWHADRETGPYLNDRSLTVKQEAQLLAWLEQGAPKPEEEADPLAAFTPEVNKGWALGEPDLVVELPKAQEIPAEGVVDYRYIPVNTPLTEDKWVSGLEVRPTNAEVVHHALIFVVYPREYEHLQPNSRSGLNGYFAGFLPGAKIVPYPEGTGQFLPKGSTFIFQMHYNTSGRAGTDQTQMALYFCDEPPGEALVIRAAAETEFKIAPNERNKRVRASFKFNKEARLWGVAPHMHYRGSWFQYDIKQGDEDRELLMNVPWYEFDWQPMYFFEKPVAVNEETRILCEGGFDNSRFNPKNPNPEQWVYFGEQSYEEMFIGYLTYSFPYKPEDFAPQEINTAEIIGYGVDLNEETLPGTKWRIVRNIVIEFQEDGKLMDQTGFIKGTWTLDGNIIEIKSPMRNVELGVRGDELLFRGRALNRVQ